MLRDCNVFRVVITCVGGDLSAQLIQSIKAIDTLDFKLQVIATDAGEEIPPAFSVSDFSYKVPFGDDADYIAKMLEIVQETNANLIVPRSDEEALALSKDRQKFEDIGCKVACIDYETLQIFANKAKTYQKLQDMNIPVAAWEQAFCNEDMIPMLDKIINNYGAAIIKPSVARGGRNVYYIAKDTTLDHSDYKSNPEITFFEYNDFLSVDFNDEFSSQFPVVVMQPLYRPVYDLDMLAWKGMPISIVPRKRVKSDYPNAGHVILGDERLIDIGEKIIRAFNLSWIYDCDLMVDKHGTPYPIEINPRMSGSIAVSLSAGAGIFESLFKILDGGDVSRQPINHLVGKTLLPIISLMENKKI